MLGRALLGGPGGGIVGFLIDSLRVTACSGFASCSGLGWSVGLFGGDCWDCLLWGEVAGGGGGAGFLLLLSVFGEAQLKLEHKQETHTQGSIKHDDKMLHFVNFGQ